MNKNEFIQRAVLALLSNSEDRKLDMRRGTEYNPKTSAQYRTEIAEQHWE